MAEDAKMGARFALSLCLLAGDALAAFAQTAVQTKLGRDPKGEETGGEVDAQIYSGEFVKLPHMRKNGVWNDFG